MLLESNTDLEKSVKCLNWLLRKVFNDIKNSDLDMKQKF